MSILAISWVLHHSEEKLGRRLVLLVLADHANEDGTGAWPAVGTIAQHARLSERQTQRCLRELEEAGAIAKSGSSPHGTAVYDVLMGGRQYDTPGGVTNAASGGDDLSPDPSLEQPPLESELRKDPPMVPHSEEIATQGGGDQALDHARPTRPGKVDRKAVTNREYELALEVLAAFNEIAGTRYASKDFVSKIVMRIREHPSLTAEMHEAVIRRALEEPWWRGPASPSVVYGNGALFERCVHTVAAGPARRGMTPAEIEALDRAPAADLELDAEEEREPCPVCGGTEWTPDYDRVAGGEERVDRCDRCGWPPSSPFTVEEWRERLKAREALDG